MELFDSHCHVNEEKFDGDREEVLARMAEHGITRYAVIGSDIATSSACVAYCRTHENAVCAVGIHPHEAKGYREGDLPIAEHHAAHCVSLPMFPELTDEEVERVVDACNAY